MKATITNTLVKTLRSTGRQYDVRDNKLQGFLIRVTGSGKMNYVCQYKRGKRVNLGQIGVLTPAQARDKAKEILGKVASGIDPCSEIEKAGQLTLSKFIKKTYAPWRLANRKNAQQDLHRLQIHFLDEFGAKKLNEISILAIEKWRTKRLNAGIKVATVNRDIAILKAALSKAEVWDLLKNNPLIKLKLLKIDDLPFVRYLQKNEERCLRQALDMREKEIVLARESANQWRQKRSYTLLPVLNMYYLKAIVLLTLNTGLRRKDLFTLSQDYIDLDNRTITIVGGIAKTQHTRHIPLNSEAFSTLSAWIDQVSLIKAWWQQNLETNPLIGKKILMTKLIFFNDRGEQFFDVKKSWKYILKKAEIKDFRFHDLRHHFASKLVMAGVDLNTVRELLGHADIKMTLRYAHLAPEHKAKAVEKLMDTSV